MELLHWSEIAKNLATTVAIAPGGLWAFWIWWHSDWPGALRHRAALDGSIAAECILLDSGLLVATIKAHWNNRGAFPVPIGGPCDATT